VNIEEIRQSFLSGCSVEYKVHCQKRMLERNITRKDVENCIRHGEIIEEYPLDKYNDSENSFPSCLILWIDVDENNVFHVVLGYKGRKIIIISAYDYKTRKGK
jgi:hypothetical protein